MAEFQYKAGLHNVGSYQVSGIPYATASVTAPTSSAAPLEIVFPSVTQVIRIHNHDASNTLRVGFSANGVKNGNYWIVDNEDAAAKKNPYLEMRVKTDRIYLLGLTAAVSPVYIMAELTGIDLDYNLAATYSGSNGIG